MKYGISKAMKRLAADYERSVTQHEREAALRKIAITSYKEERDRERKLRKAKCREHLADIVHLAAIEEAESRKESPTWISDGGKGEEAVMASVAKSFYTLCIKRSRELLKRKQPELVTVFDLVVKNGTNREESICELAARDKHGKDEAKDRYSRNLEEILKFFQAQ